jgi:hypothetical protein
MSDLVEFLRPRLDEDAVDATMRAVHREGCESVPDAEGYTYPCTCGVPERLMREVEAKRRIIERYEQAASQYWNATEEEIALTLEPVLRDLALPYADHPDYQHEWKPEISQDL